MTKSSNAAKKHQIICDIEELITNRSHEALAVSTEGRNEWNFYSDAIQKLTIIFGHRARSDDTRLEQKVFGKRGLRLEIMSIMESEHSVHQFSQVNSYLNFQWCSQ